MSLRVTLTQEIYPVACLYKTIQAYQEVCNVSVHHTSESGYVIDIGRRSPEVDERVLSHEFLNYLLDLALEHHLSQA